MAKKPGNVNVNVNVKRIGRKRRAAGWTLLTLGVIVAGVWVASGWWSAAWVKDHLEIRCYRGVVRMSRNRMLKPGWSSYPATGNGRRFVWALRPGNLAVEDMPPAMTGGLYTTWGTMYDWAVSINLWPIPLLLWTPAALLLRSGILARRRAATGSCAKCGYSLAGLSAGAACPDCGKGAAAG